MCTKTTLVKPCQSKIPVILEISLLPEEVYNAVEETQVYWLPPILLLSSVLALLPIEPAIPHECACAQPFLVVQTSLSAAYIQI